MTDGFGIGWRQVGICFFLLAAISMIAAGYSVLAVPLGNEFQTSRMVLMLAMTVLSLVSALLAPLLGNLMDRVPVKRMMIAGCLILASGYVALSYATTMNQVLVIFGLFMAPGNVLLGPMAATVLLSRWFVNRRGTAVGIAIAGISIGSVIYPPIIQYLLDNYEWREAFRLLALVVLCLTLPGALLVVNSPADKGLHPDGADAAPVVSAAARDMPRVSVVEVLTDPAFWLCCAIFAVVSSGMKGLVTNLVPLAVDEGIKASDAALLISIYGGCGFVAKLAFAAFADRMSPRTLLLATLVGFGTGMAVLTQAQLGYPTILLGLGFVGLFGGMMVPLQSLLIPRIFGDRVVGRAMGLMSMVTLVALVFAPPAFGLIFDVTGNYDGIFYALAGLAVAVMLAVPYIRLHPRVRADAAAVAVPAE